MNKLAVAGFLTVFVLLCGDEGIAQMQAPDARASQTIQSCIKSARDPVALERCIDTLVVPCLERPEANSTAGQVACADRELAVWDDILNETYRRLREKLDDEQKAKLRDMQRAWIASRDKSCAFYWDFHQGTIAVPMAALCKNRETARRALFLLGFLNEAEGR